MKTYTVKIDDNGDKCWYLDGKLHREDGPAIEWADGTRFWHRNGKRHREDGPAIEWANGNKEWYLDDKRLSESKFMTRTKSCNGKVVTIDGKQYKLVEVK